MLARVASCYWKILVDVCMVWYMVWQVEARALDHDILRHLPLIIFDMCVTFVCVFMFVYGLSVYGMYVFNGHFEFPVIKVM